MYTPPQSFTESLLQDSRTFHARLTFADSSQIDSIREYTLQRTGSSGDDITIGGAFASELQVSLITDREIHKGSVFTLSLGLEDTYVPEGTFTVAEASGKGTEKSVTAYDVMYTAGSAKLVVVTETRSWWNRIRQAAGYLGVELDESNLQGIEDFDILSVEYSTTIAGYIGNLAGLVGMNAYIDRNNRMTLRMPADSGYVFDTGRGNITGLQDTAREVQAISCGDDLIGDQDAEPVVMDDPLATTADLQRILTAYNTFSCHGGEIDLMLGDNRLDPWDIITAAGKKFLCSVIVSKYDGGLQTRIESRVSAGQTGTGIDSLIRQIYYTDGRVTDLEGNAVSAVVYEYALTSTTDPPGASATWLADDPGRIPGMYTWKRTVTYYADAHQEYSTPELLTGKDGEDATTIVISSSKGILFKSDQFRTDMTVTIFYGPKVIQNGTALREAYGNTAYLEWRWRKSEDDDFHVISSSDSRLSNDGFMLSITPADVDESIVFQCDLIL